VRRPGLDAGPAQWSVVPFAKALRDDTAGQVKIFRRDYGSSGELPIIDQGAEKIAGYTDDRSAAYQGALPVILFGDHTRVFKYVDSPFALGADGVKALQPAPSFEPKFLYYYLINADIPGRGYSRHFKFLREIHFPLAAPSEQRRIVEILDQADRLHRLRAEADVKAGPSPRCSSQCSGIRPRTRCGGLNGLLALSFWNHRETGCHHPQVEACAAGY